MKSIKNLLVGKWEFIGAQKHNGTEWESTTYVEGMIWEFNPIFLSDNKIIGNLAEFTATSDEPISLNYTFAERENHLRIEIYTDHNTMILDEADLYAVSCDNPAELQPTIVLNLINQIGCPPPYLRYILRQVE